MVHLLASNGTDLMAGIGTVYYTAYISFAVVTFSRLQYAEIWHKKRIFLC